MRSAKACDSRSERVGTLHCTEQAPPRITLTVDQILERSSQALYRSRLWRLHVDEAHELREEAEI